MSIVVQLNRPLSAANVKVKPVDGTLRQTSSYVPVTLKNITNIGKLNNLEDLQDVSIVNKINNSTVVFNSETNKYEIKLLDIDGGIF
jgi:hypothetical protein